MDPRESRILEKVPKEAVEMIFSTLSDWEDITRLISLYPSWRPMAYSSVLHLRNVETEWRHLIPFFALRELEGNVTVYGRRELKDILEHSWQRLNVTIKKRLFHDKFFDILVSLGTMPDLWQANIMSSNGEWKISIDEEVLELVVPSGSFDRDQAEELYPLLHALPVKSFDGKGIKDKELAKVLASIYQP